MRSSLILFFLFFALASQGAVGNDRSGFSNEDFDRYWYVESEAANYQQRLSGDTCEIIAPKGLTLWYKEKLHDGQAVEYDVCIIDEGGEGDRVSDMNCFWMASDPGAADLWQRAPWRTGIFLRCYTLQMYYLGFGGNSNSTTRFRRYYGDARGVDSAQYRPAILKEYTDREHLLKGNHWYHLRVESNGGHNRFFVDGEEIVDYLDANQLKEGWFGFRTTWSHFKITNFKVLNAEDPALAPAVLSNGATTSASLSSSSSVTPEIPLHWILPNDFQGTKISSRQGTMAEKESTAEPSLSIASSWPVTFGVPFLRGEVREPSLPSLKNSENLPADAWVLGRWDDGSVKWAGLSAVANATADEMTLFCSSSSANIIDSICLNGRKIAGPVSLSASTADGRKYLSMVESVSTEQEGNIRKVIKISGHHRLTEGGGALQQWLPFVIRLYSWKGCDKVKMVHTVVYDGDEERDAIQSMGITTAIPMRGETYEREVAFTTGDRGIWRESVRPLGGRKRMMTGRDDALIGQLAQWDGYRLSCLTDNSFTIRKRANSHRPWIGTFSGTHAPGMVYLGGPDGGVAVAMNDFWQSYPSTIEVGGATGDEALLTMWLWSPENEAMDLRHYDDKAHGLQASYEDVQEGMSSAYGIARTTTLWLTCFDSVPTNERLAMTAELLDQRPLLMPTVDYLHAKKAFGYWSVADSSATGERGRVEKRLADYIDYYLHAVKERKWYGFWNYGDIMHQYDEERHQWKYDMGGYAWDNTELASPSWLWYSFLRTGRHDIWQMAEAMTRHNGEVDTYHKGTFAALGTRHGVSHWGDGAKEARISQAAFNRFYHYLAADERAGDLMREVRDADTLLYRLDPMRLAEPREKFPCSAPARLRLGPDWMAYASNWFAEWERTGDTRYRHKIIAGMKSIAGLRHGFFTGNKALGYDPATGIISYDGDSARQNTNHLITIMGGFEIMNEIMMMVDIPEFNRCWLQFAKEYKEKARTLSKNHFPVRRLMAYAAAMTGDDQLRQQAWDDLWHRIEHRAAPRFDIHTLQPPLAPATMEEGLGITTNDAALWSLDAIYMLEVLK